MSFETYVKAFWSFVAGSPDKPLNYYDLSTNPNITPDIVKENPDKPWHYSLLSENHNITWDIVKENPDKPWHYALLSRNKMTLQNKLIEERCRKEWEAVSVIKRNFIKVFWNPQYLLGRKRLLRSYENDDYSVW